MENKAKYTVSSSANKGILEIVLTGEVIESSAEKLTKEVISIVIKEGMKDVLVDIRTLKGNLGFADTYFRVRSYPRDFHTIRGAVVYNKEDAELHSFYEITAQNAGFMTKCFTDIHAARSWLKSK